MFKAVVEGNALMAPIFQKGQHKAPIPARGYASADAKTYPKSPFGYKKAPTSAEPIAVAKRGNFLGKPSQ
ncbi:MAG: hypothetical protein FWG12_07510 [Holophagaceae bacterium]|nr:hypothetical protein [Holophagaceae bacterium]